MSRRSDGKSNSQDQDRVYRTIRECWNSYSRANPSDNDHGLSGFNPRFEASLRRFKPALADIYLAGRNKG